MRLIRKIHQFFVDKPLENKTLINRRYEVLSLIGTGSYGILYLCNDLYEKDIKILKQLRPSRRKKKEEVDLLINEIEILTMIQHENIPTLYDSFSDQKNYFFVMKYMEGYNLDKEIFKNKKKLNELESLLLFYKILKIVDYLHKMSIFHLDLRLPNILIHQEEAYLIDFGLAKVESDAYKFRQLMLEDFYDLGDILLFLLYTTFIKKRKKALPWTEELLLKKETVHLLKRLINIDAPYSNVNEIFTDLEQAIKANN